MAIPILMYHNVAPAPRHLKRWRSLYVSPGSFSRQMHLLHALGYRVLSMSDAMPYLAGEKRGKVVVATLDDGYADNVVHALPALQRFGFTATCYVVAGALGSYNAWDAEKLGVRKPTMTREQVRQWHDAGMEVGAHTLTHPKLSQCDDRQLREELGGSKRLLEDLTGAGVSQFCYPYGDMDERVEAATRAAGFVAATTIQRGRATPGMNLMRLPRVKISRHHILPQFMQRTLTGYEDRK